MKTITTFSLTGGTGRTTVAGGLAGALAALGRPVLLVDADPQNALGLPLGLGVGDRVGLARLTPEEPDAGVRRGLSGPAWLPFGACTSEELLAIERAQVADPDWLGRRLALAVPPDTELVVLDTPAGVRAASLQALRAADLVVVVVRPDAGSYATLVTVDALLDALPRVPAKALLVNGFDSRRALDVDVRAALEQAFPEALLPFTVPEDEAVREAFARQLPLRDSAPDSQAAAILAHLAGWVAEHV